MSIEDFAAPQTGPQAPLGTPHTSQPWKRVLVPLDGSPLAESVLPAASRLSRLLGLEMVLMRAVRDEPPRVVDGGRHVVIDHTAERTREAEEYLRRIAAGLAAEGFRVQCVVRAGDAPREILDAARQHAADLIAMATHGRSGFGRLFRRSVTEAVLHRAHVPVVVTRATEAAPAVKAA